jgi:Galactose oxidase, central domain
MTDQRELDRLLVAYLADGTNELADRVIDAALDQIARTRQRHPLRVPRRLPTMTMPVRLATAAVIGVIMVGGAFYLARPGEPAVGPPAPTPTASPRPSQAAGTPTPTSPPGPMGAGRQIHTATRLVDGRVLVAGGYASNDFSLESATLYDPADDTFAPTGSLAAARGMHTATRLADGRVLIAGGGPASWSIGGAYLASAELYDPATGTFSPTGPMTTTREDHTATLLADGRVLITGGDDVGSHAVASAELYDPGTGTFSATGTMTTARGFHTATLLDDGRVLVVGGAAAAWSPGPYLASAELYDPTTGTFSSTGSMSVGRVYHIATLLADDRVLVAGGGGEYVDQSLASAELYDPDTGSFSSTGSMTAGRVYESATLLPDGRVLIAGGMPDGGDYATGTFLASAETYDPATGSFAGSGQMAETRVYHTGTLLSDGRVLVTGGFGNRVVLAALDSAELYDPTTGTFGPAGDGR